MDVPCIVLATAMSSFPDFGVAAASVKKRESSVFNCVMDSLSSALHALMVNVESIPENYVFKNERYRWEDSTDEFVDFFSIKQIELGWKDGPIESELEHIKEWLEKNLSALEKFEGKTKTNRRKNMRKEYSTRVLLLRTSIARVLEQAYALEEDFKKRYIALEVKSVLNPTATVTSLL
jgi:hypothetical protein